MPSWYIDPTDPNAAAFPTEAPHPDPDTIRVPRPYTDEEWAETEGAHRDREYRLAGRVVEVGGFEGHIVYETVVAPTLHDAIEIARTNRRERGERVAGWIAL